MIHSRLTLRLATTADAAAIAAIYNEGTADRIATFETEPRTADQIAVQLADKGDRFPTVVVRGWLVLRCPHTRSPRAAEGDTTAPAPTGREPLDVAPHPSTP
jgi:hypothetical protein